MATKMKKFKAKTHKGTRKRIKITRGGDLLLGKLIINRINDNHRNIGKSRNRTLKAKRSTTLDAWQKKLKKVLR